MRKGSLTIAIDRRTEILAVAARLFREKGYPYTSLDDITREIGVTKPAIYYYFKAKEDILYEICVTQIKRLMNQAHAIAATDLDIAEKIRKIFAGHIMEFHINRDVAESYWREAAHLSLERRKEVSNMLKQYEYFIRDHVDQGIAEGVFRPINTRQVVRGIGGMVFTIGNWYRPEGPDDINTIIDAYVDFIMNGLMKK